MNAFSLSLAWLPQAHILTQALCRGMPKLDCMRYFPILNYLPTYFSVCVRACVRVRACVCVRACVQLYGGLFPVQVCMQ